MSDTSPILTYSGDSSLPNSKTLAVDLGLALVPNGGDLVITPENMLGELQSIVGTGILAVTGTDTLALRSITSSTLAVTHGDGVAGNITIEQLASSSVQLINVQDNGMTVGSPVSTLNFVGGTGSGVSVSVVGSVATCTLTSFANPMTTQGDLVLGGISGAATRLALGTSGQVLKSNGTTVTWSSDTGFTNPMTTAGDLILGGSSGTPGRLAIGTNGQVLKSNGTTAAWSSDTGFSNPMTSVGDLIVGGASGTPGRLALGTSGQALKSNGTTTAWAFDAPVDAYYITTQTNSTLTNEVSLGALATGILAISVSAGVATPSSIPVTISSDNVNQNLAIGTLSGTAPGGTSNLFVGYNTGVLANPCAGSTFIGHAAGSGHTTYTSCTLIGDSTDVTANGLTNANAIGAGATVSASNTLVLGVAGTMTVIGATAATAGNYALNLDVNSSSASAWMGRSASQTAPSTAGGVFSVDNNDAPRFTAGPSGFSGSMVVAGASNGTIGQVLTANGAGIAPSWQTPSAAPNVFKGSATLSGGTVTVNTADVTAGASITVTYDVINSLGTISVPSAGIVPGVSFIINSTSAGDASTVNWIMVV